MPGEEDPDLRLRALSIPFRYITIGVFSILTMSSQNTYSLRIVVQHVSTNRQSSYRLVAYGGDYTCRPANFESLDHLVKALRLAVPDFDESALFLRKDAPDTYIAFSGEMELDETQLLLLGLKDGARS